jgi:hypothetical protein
MMDWLDLITVYLNAFRNGGFAGLVLRHRPGMSAPHRGRPRRRQQAQAKFRKKS